MDRSQKIDRVADLLLPRVEQLAVDLVRDVGFAGEEKFERAVAWECLYALAAKLEAFKDLKDEEIDEAVEEGLAWQDVVDYNG